MSKPAVHVGLEIGIGIEVGDLDSVDGVKLAANQNMAFRGWLTDHISTD